MKLFTHSILCGVGVEAILVAASSLFSCGSCNSSLPGTGIMYLHYPAFLFSEHVLRLPSDRQYFVDVPIVMTAVWISVFAAAGYIKQIRARRRYQHDDTA